VYEPGKVVCHACGLSQLGGLYDRSMEAIAAFVLAGGRSSRMGSDKALLELGGKPLIARAVELAREVTRDVIIVGDASKYAEFGPVIADKFTGRGPLGGIHAALSSSNSDRNLVLAVDLPFLYARFLNYLIAQAVGYDATVTVPSTNGYFQPLCAVYRKPFVDAAERALAEGRNKIDALFDEVSLRAITEEEMTANGFSAGMFRNLNTREEWEKAEREFVGEQ
jgi:molybdenum cofactor guanylyltransferase